MKQYNKPRKPCALFGLAISVNFHIFFDQLTLLRMLHIMTKRHNYITVVQAGISVAQYLNIGKKLNQ